MKYSQQTLIRDLLSTLNDATGMKWTGEAAPVDYPGVDGRTEAVNAVVAELPGRAAPIELAIVMLSTAYPRDVRVAVDKLAAYTAYQASQGRQMKVASLVTAEYLSKGARDALRLAGVGYYDRSGSTFFKHGTWLCCIQRELKQPVSRKLVSLFSGAREQVIHALLMDWLESKGERWLSGSELVKAAGTSAATVSMTMQELERLEWVEVVGKGPTQRRRVQRAAELLDAWAEAWCRRAKTEPRSRWYGYAGGAKDLPSMLTAGLPKRSDWALTGALPANQLSPHLTSVDRAMVVVPPGAAQEWAQAMGLKEASQGSNVTMVEREGASLMFSTRHDSGALQASPFVMYLDLLDGVGRHKELAQELRSRVLGLPPAASEPD